MMGLLTARNFLFLFILLTIVWGAVWSLSSFRTWGPGETSEIIPDNADLTLKNITYTKTREGVPQWTLLADSAAHSMEDRITRVKNVHMTFYDPNGSTIELTSDDGALMPDLQMVTVSNNVLLTNLKGSTLQTDYLEFEEVSKTLQTDKVVKIIFDQFTVTGRGMRVDIVARTLEILNEVNARLGGTDSH